MSGDLSDALQKVPKKQNLFFFFDPVARIHSFSKVLVVKTKLKKTKIVGP